MAQPLTVAHVDTEMGFSGGQVQVFLLIDGLAAAGVTNVLCCRPGSIEEARARERGYVVVPVSMRGDWQLTAIPRLARAFAAQGAELVHLHTGRANWLGGWAARFARLPAITTRRMDRPLRRGRWTARLYGELVRRAVAISPAVARRLAEAGVPAERIVTICSAVDAAALAPSREHDVLRAELGASPEARVFLGLARLTRRKGFDVALAALARLEQRDDLPSWRFWLAGDGEQAAALRRQAHALGLDGRVVFLGARDDRADLLAAADVLLMPSRAEGLGIAALEAMACGLPVVACRVGGLADAVVEGQTGLLVPPDDAPALASALATLLTDEPLRTHLGAAGPARVQQHFSPAAMVDAYLALYREVLQGADGADGAR